MNVIEPSQSAMNAERIRPEACCDSVLFSTCCPPEAKPACCGQSSHTAACGCQADISTKR
jgi:hypothetical protein